MINILLPHLMFAVGLWGGVLGMTYQEYPDHFTFWQWFLIGIKPFLYYNFMGSFVLAVFQHKILPWLHSQSSKRSLRRSAS
jgi:hypothetical protein